MTKPLEVQTGEPRWLDGPMFCEWLTTWGGVEHIGAELGTRWSRRYSEWKRGAKADFYVADKLLIKLGHHPSDLPEELFLAVLRRPRKALLECKGEVMRRVREGESPTALALEYEISRSTISFWRKQEGSP